MINDVEVERRAGGKLFHARGPATANARSPMDARQVDASLQGAAVWRFFDNSCNQFPVMVVTNVED